jgi:glycosyltransferase involved in cell wall biosynthesis
VYRYKPLRILLINHYAGSDSLGMEFRPFYLCREWVKNGYEPLIVGSSYSHLRKKQPAKLGYSQESKVDYLWLWGNKYKKNGLMRLVNMLLFIFQLFILAPYLALKFKPHFVIASSTYPLDIFPSWMVAKLSRAKLIFEIHDLWPLSPMELGGYSKYHPFIIIMRFGEWFAYKFSDKIVSILPNTYEHVKKDGIPLERWAHIPNGIDFSTLTDKEELPPPVKKLIAKLKKEKKFLIGYTGSFGPGNALHVILDALKKVNNPNAFTLFVGTGPLKKYLQDEIKSNNLNALVLDSISKRSVQNFLGEMDILISAGIKSKFYEYGVSPNKIFEYMYSKKPIVQSITTTVDLIKIANCGITVDAENADLLAKAIDKIYKMPKSKRAKLGENGYAYVVKNHNFSHLAKQFIDAMDDYSL